MTPPTPESPYQILQVDERAQAEVIQAAYHRLARLYHPDSGTTSDPERMKAINQAWEVLQSESRRAHYDASRNRPEANQARTEPFEEAMLGSPGWGETYEDPLLGQGTPAAEPTLAGQYPPRSPYPGAQHPPGYYPAQAYGSESWQPVAYPDYAAYPAPNRHVSTNGLAVAAFVLAMLWLFSLGSALGVVFGFVALRQIKRTGTQRGRGLAIAGILIGCLGVAFLVMTIWLAATSPHSTPGAILPLFSI